MISTKRITVLLISLFFSTMLFAETCEVKIKIKPPRNNGGTPITGYWIEVKSQYDTKWERLINWSLLPEIQEYTYKGDFEPIRYEFRVIAINKYGLSKPSDPDYADFSKSNYWEIFLVCEDGATKSIYSKSHTNTFDINSLLDISPKETNPIPYRL